VPYTSNVQDTAESSKYYIGFPRGLNTIQDENMVDDKNLAQADNVIIDVDGVRRRPGTTKSFNQLSNTKIYGSGVLNNKVTGNKYWLRIGSVGKLEQFNTTSLEWEVVADTPTWSAGNVEFVQARNRAYIYNGIDNLRYYDGSTITQFTQLDTPTGLAVTATGVTGSTAYSYRVEALNATGRTAACARVAIANGNATLSTSNYNALTWNAVSGASAYNVYGRKQDGIGEEYMDTVYTNAYNDTGADTPVDSLLPNVYNTTGGIKAYKAIYAPFGRQIAIGVTEGSVYQPTRLYYSGVLDYIDAFVGGDYGGGWVEIRSNDGGELLDIVPYQSGILVLKSNGIFKFSFTAEGLPKVEEIASSHGGVSYRGGQLIDNDYVYVAQKDNRVAIMTVGQQQNYVGDQLRTNDISILISDGMTTIERSELKNICTFYYDYKFAFAYTKTGGTENSEGYILDTRYGGWVKWSGDPMKVTGWIKYDDGTNNYLYGMSNLTGYMIKMMETDRNDSDVAFTSMVSTKSYSMNMFNVKKVFRNPSLWFKYFGQGTLTLYVYADTKRLIGTATISLSPYNSGTMVGVDLAGEALAGVSAYEVAGLSESTDYPQEITMLNMSRSLRFVIKDTNKNTDWLFMGVNILFTPLEGMPLEQEFKVYLT